MVSGITGLRCREIEEPDVGAVAALLARGFPAHSCEFWRGVLAQLTRHEPPPGLPRYGYLLAAESVVVGAILLICSSMRTGDTRCNLSSWYVEPAFRAYAPMLALQAMRHENVTYTNVSAAPHTRPIIEAQGFARYSEGIFVAFPALNGLFRRSRVTVFGADRQPEVAFDPFDREVLLRHVAHGCLGLWCSTPEQAYPFVFRARRAMAGIPYAQLIYCRSVSDFVRFAGPIGRLLAGRGWPFVILDANSSIPGLIGWFSRGRMPKYFKGPQRPRLGDLAYTENGVLGI